LGPLSNFGDAIECKNPNECQIYPSNPTNP